MESVTGYKIARPDGWDFYTGKTINYRKNVGKIVRWDETKVWSAAVFKKKINIASSNPNDCFRTDCFRYYVEPGSELELWGGDFYPVDRFAIYKSRKYDVHIDGINCSAFRVRGVPVCSEKRMWSFEELEVLEEIKDLDSLFGWKYSEAINLVNPLKHKAKVTPEDIELLRSWASIYESVLDSLDASDKSLFGPFATRSLVFDSVSGPITKLVGRVVYNIIIEPLSPRPFDELYPMGTDFRSLVGDPATIKVWNAVYPHWLWDKASPNKRLKNPVYDSFSSLCLAYMGSLFPNINKWKNIKHKKGEYPFQPAADLWQRWLVPSFDGSIWRLHTGKKAEVAYEKQAQATL